MSEFERLAQEATAKAALAAGKDAAKRAVDELLTGEQAKVEKAEDAAPSKGRRYKTIALVVLALCLVVGLIGLLLSYWYWFLAAGVVGLAGLIGYSRLKSRLAKAKPSDDRKVEPAAEKAPALERTRTPPDAEAVRAALEAKRAEAAARQRALAEAEAMREQEVDEELAAMKARLKK